ncbi:MULTISPECIES: MBL fold metallo-hydrolase [Anaerolinea]|uniref:MBL fold metallo-hydrolase n=1 Tax=Anaerolinea TaxID=233189 RepID=UPI00260C768D|nr:MBL fold metallo-hydrolase [Anaerolinea thermophila]
MSERSFSIRFWGVRGSYPMPGETTVRYGGNTPCVEVQVNGYTIILDAGTGIIPLGRDLMRRARTSGKPVEAVLLFSHLHHDHTQGFPFFAPAFLPTTRLHIFGPDFLASSPKVTLDTVMNPPYFPIRLAELNAWLGFATVRETDVILIGESVGGVALFSASDTIPAADPNLVLIRILRSYAHPQGVLHYRIDWRNHALVYATDTEGYVNGDRRLANFARGADVLIHDAQYTDEHYLGLVPGLPNTQGFGHSTISIAVQAAQAAQAGRLVLFHHAPEYSDDQLDFIQEQVERILPGTVVAQEGMTLTLYEEDEPLPPRQQPVPVSLPRKG